MHNPVYVRKMRSLIAETQSAWKRVEAMANSNTLTQSDIDKWSNTRAKVADFAIWMYLEE